MHPLHTPLTRRTLLALPAAACLVPRVAKAASILSADDCRRLLAQVAVPSGQYKGAFLTGPAGAVNWYFNQLALRQLLPDLDQPTIEAFLNAFFANVDLAFDMAIDDYNYSDSPPFPKTADSHDAYAATLISLAVAFLRQFPSDSGTLAWWNYRLRQLKSLVWTNLMAEPALNARGLTRARRELQPHPLVPRLVNCPGDSSTPCPASPVGFLMDQCEVWAALNDFGTQLAAMQDPFATEVLAARDRLGIAIHSRLFHPTAQRWLPNDTDPFDADFKSWYPHTVCQIFPEFYGVASDNPAADQLRFAAGRRYLEASQPDWTTYPQYNRDRNGALSPEPFPWLVVGCFYATRKDPKSLVMLNNALSRYLTNLQWQGYMTIHDLGYARAIVRLLQV